MARLERFDPVADGAAKDAISMLTGISAITLATHDMARAAAFYQALGFVLKFGGPTAPFTSFQVGSSYLNLTSMPTECEWSWWGRVIFYVDDVDAQCMQGLYQLASRPDSPRGMPHGANDISTWSIPTDTNSASRDRSDTLLSAAWRAGSRRARWSDSGTVKQQHREDDMAAGLISCDDHMDLGQLPADLWETRLPVALRDRSPHVEERDGQAVWICDGKVWGRWDGKPPATGSARPIKPIYTALDRAGIHDNSARRPANANLRLADMDRDGVQTQLIFGPIFQISTDDPVLRASCYQVFNDWLLDFCAVAPDRLIGVPMLPENPQGALKELERLVARGGVRQVNLMIANVNPKLDDPAWELLWNTLEASGIILAWHITVFVGRPGDRAAGKAASVFENTKFFLGNFLEPFVDLFAWGILERHPKLRVVMAEAGTGWLPWLVQELDYRHWRLWEAKEFWADKGGSALVTKPSELFQRQIYATFQEDYVALSLLPFFGEGHLLWASDYPHPDSVWPNSRDAIERQMHHLTPQMRRALTHDNAATLYGLA